MFSARKIVLIISKEKKRVRHYLSKATNTIAVLSEMNNTEIDLLQIHKPDLQFWIREIFFNFSAFKDSFF